MERVRKARFVAAAELGFDLSRAPFSASSAIVLHAKDRCVANAMLNAAVHIRSSFFTHI